jgi:hypothetical protein
MQPQNHASRPKGIPKTKLQGSGPSGGKTLQSQIAQSPKNRLTFNRLAVVHGRLINAPARAEVKFLSVRSFAKMTVKIVKAVS